MSEEPRHPHLQPQPPGDPRPRSEEDRVPSGAIVGVGAAALVLFLLASAVATKVLQSRRAEQWPAGRPPLPAELGKAKIGMIEQQLFENTATGVDWADAQRRQLESWGWLDRKAGVVHMPIDLAMDRVVRGERP